MCIIVKLGSRRSTLPIIVSWLTFYMHTIQMVHAFLPFPYMNQYWLGHLNKLHKAFCTSQCCVRRIIAHLQNLDIFAFEQLEGKFGFQMYCNDNIYIARNSKDALSDYKKNKNMNNVRNKNDYEVEIKLDVRRVL